MIIISACLCGINCKYNHGNCLHPQFAKMLKKGQVIPLCPEQLGGLSTPREPCEIKGGAGLEVLQGRARVLNQKGHDVTGNFIRGAEETLALATIISADLAILKSRSPSCGVKQVYDGSFSSRLIKGDGVTAALLKQNHIDVISDEEYLNNTRYKNR